MKRNFLLLLSFWFFSCGTGKDVKKNLPLDKYVVVDADSPHPCGKEFVVIRTTPDEVNFQSNHLLAQSSRENSACLLYFRFLFDDDKYFVDKITLIDNSNENKNESKEEILLESLQSVKLDAIGVGSRLQFHARYGNEDNVLFRLYMQGRNPRQPFTTARVRN